MQMQIANYMWPVSCPTVLPLIARRLHEKLCTFRSLTHSHSRFLVSIFILIPLARHHRAAFNRKSMRSHATSKAFHSMPAICNYVSTLMTSASLAKARSSNSVAVPISWVWPTSDVKVECVPQSWRSRTTATINDSPRMAPVPVSEQVSSNLPFLSVSLFLSEVPQKCKPTDIQKTSWF